MVVLSTGKMDIKPRIISAEVKRADHNSITTEVHNSKPHIAGELDLVGETTSEPHWVEVRDGHLVVYPRSINATASPVWRLPLTCLNLQPAASGRPRGFSLTRHGESVPLATFQVNNELEYERWVKTLAAELMRQTPLEAVRFLDILGITATIPPRVSLSRELLVDEHFVSVDVEPPGGRWTSLFRPNTDCHKQVNNNNNNYNNSNNTLNRKLNVCLNRGCDKVDSGAVVQRSLSETFTKCKVPKVNTVHFKEQPTVLCATSVKEPNIIKENVTRIRFVESNVIPVNCKEPDSVSFRYKESNSNCVTVKGVSVGTGYGNCEQKLPKKVTSVVDCKSATVVDDKVTARDINQNVYSNQFKESDLVPDRSNKVKSLLKTFLSEDQKNTKDFSRRTIRNESATLGRPPLPDVIKDLPPCERRSRARTRLQEAVRFRGQSAEPWHTSQCQGSESESGDETAVNELMARCQQGDKYVPVRDKRLLFESLCRRSGRRFVCSSDNISEIAAVTDRCSIPKQPPRTQSLHDLTRYNSVAVKEICRYFEQRGGSRGETTTRSPSPECRLRLEDRRKDVTAVEYNDRRQFNRAQRRLARIRQNITDSEETVWRLQEQSNKLARGRRNEATRLQASIEQRLQEERDRLKKFQDEALKMQRDIDIAADKFVVVPAKVRHHSNVL